MVNRQKNYIFASRLEKMQKVQVKILGISEVKSSQDIYWLLLEEVLGERRVPILIGKMEAQSISASSQQIETPVPFTHQLFINITDNFNIKLKDVLIFSKEEGVFFAQQTWQHGSHVFLIESRASDGIALAMACETPIFMDAAIFDKLEQTREKETDISHETLEELPEETLNKLLKNSIEEEDYELASQIRDELERRKNKTQL